MSTSFRWPIRVYYEDTDAGGIVYYANYLKFLERARTEWLRSLSIEQDFWLERGIGFVVRSVQLELKSPARFNDELTVVSTISQMRRASVTFLQQVFNAAGELLCDAEIKAACVTLGQPIRPAAMPAEIIEGFKRAN